VSLSASAIDDNGDPMTFGWDFGDGTTGLGKNVVHQFAKGAPSYNVKLMVDDGHLGQAPRPVNLTKLIPVTPNSPPTCSVPDVSSGPIKNQGHVYPISSTDVNTRDVMRFTWDWGDGSALTVTDVAAATHTYSLAKTYTMTVWADDRTGLTGHNVSDTGLVSVANSGTPLAPVITLFSASSLVPGMGDVVTFTATVTDGNTDPCRLTFDFGDGTTKVVYQPTAGSTVTATHVYTTAGLVGATLTAFDGVLSATSGAPLIIDVQPRYVLNLQTGWNLVTVPPTGFGYKASTLGLSPGDTVARWNSATKTYTSHIVGVPVNDFNILPGIGYWINVPTGTRTLYLQGTIPTAQQNVTITLPAGGGWAIIGFNSLKTTMKAADVRTMYTGGSVTTVAKYNPVTKSYTSWLSTIPTINNFALVPGQAYWILATASGTLSYMP
jgi:hypothetical protein